MDHPTCCNAEAKRSAPTPNPRPCLYLACEIPHRVLASSPEFEALLGFRTEELAQRSLRNITGPNTDTKNFQSSISSCARGLRSEKFFSFYRKDGHEVPCFLQIYLSEYNGERAIKVDFNPFGVQIESREHADCPSRLEKQACEQHDCNSLSARLATSTSGWSDRSDSSEFSASNHDAVDPAVILHMKAQNLQLDRALGTIKS